MQIIREVYINTEIIITIIIIIYYYRKKLFLQYFYTYFVNFVMCNRTCTEHFRFYVSLLADLYGH